MKHVLLVLVLSGFSWNALAIPAFARKFNVTCTTCHTAFPMLNKTGRTFKERGYRLPDEDGNITEEMQNRLKISDSLVLEKMLPLAIRAQTIGVDLGAANPDGSGIQNQFTPINDLALLAFGNFFQYSSFMIIAEAGAPDAAASATAFDFGVTARFATHPSVYFNLASGYAPLFAIDPYPSLMSVDDPITIHDRKILKIKFADDKTLSFSDPMPFAAVYGRAGKLYYSASLTSGRNTIAAINPRVGQARLAFDLTDTLQIGAFGVGGTATMPDAGDAKLWLAGFDTNWSTQQYVFSAIGRATGGEGNASGIGLYRSEKQLAIFVASGAFGMVAIEQRDQQSSQWIFGISSVCATKCPCRY
ncbi:MAG: hypothetical protein WCK49_04960 [Myxococcaceae bacterium]